MSENAGAEEQYDWSSFGGFFEDAGLDVQKVADDPFGFGDSYHPIMVKEWRNPAVSATGKFGSYFVFEYMEDQFSGMRPFGNWVQLPTPKALQIATGIPFDPETNPDDQKVAYNFKRLIWAFGYKANEMNLANPMTAVSRVFLAKLFAREENGYWKVGFGFAGIRPMPEVGSEEYNALMAKQGGGTAAGLNEFAQNGGNGGMSQAEAALLKDMDEA